MPRLDPRPSGISVPIRDPEPPGGFWPPFLCDRCGCSVELVSRLPSGLLVCSVCISVCEICGNVAPALIRHHHGFLVCSCCVDRGDAHRRRIRQHLARLRARG